MQQLSHVLDAVWAWQNIWRCKSQLHDSQEFTLPRIVAHFSLPTFWAQNRSLKPNFCPKKLCSTSIKKRKLDWFLALRSGAHCTSGLIEQQLLQLPGHWTWSGAQKMCPKCGALFVVLGGLELSMSKWQKTECTKLQQESITNIEKFTFSPNVIVVRK